MTTLRRLVTRKNLLQWTTAARTVRIFGDEATPATTLVKMLPSMLAVVTLADPRQSGPRSGRCWLQRRSSSLWLSASQIAHRISRPDRSETIRSHCRSRCSRLRTLARRTWLYYEHFVGPDGNWLPPDHFQEAPRGVLAQRTSPTNIGLYLLTVLAAHDLGYVGMTNMAVRLFATFSTLETMTRYRGHFLNWIDTRTLETLPPGLRLHGRQRQPGRQPDCAQTRVSGHARADGVALGSVAGPVDLLLLLADSLPAPDATGCRRRQWETMEQGSGRVAALEHLSEIRHQVLAVRE